MTNPESPRVSRLCERLGCRGCSQFDRDDFLIDSKRFYCRKRRRTFHVNEKEHMDCNFWTFNGDEKAAASALDRTGNLFDFAKADEEARDEE